MDCLQVPATAPGVPRQHQVGSMLNRGGISVTGSSFFREGVHDQQFQWQWLNHFPAPAIEQKPQLIDLSVMTIAFQDVGCRWDMRVSHLSPLYLSGLLCGLMRVGGAGSPAG